MGGSFGELDKSIFGNKPPKREVFWWQNMKKQTNKSIGIIGGMGPEASARMLKVMVSMAADEFGARNGEDFPEIIVDSIPIPDFISDKKNIHTALNMLKKRVNKLNRFNISHFGIACNTAHILFDDLNLISDAPFISMIDEVAGEILQKKIGRVGLLASPMTIESGLYQKALENNIGVILPTYKQVEIIEDIIRNVIACRSSLIDSRRLLSITKSLEKRGAQGIILGCTELPIVFPRDKGFLVFDSVEILSRTLLRKHYK